MSSFFYLNTPTLVWVIYVVIAVVFSPIHDYFASVQNFRFVFYLLKLGNYVCLFISFCIMFPAAFRSPKKNILTILTHSHIIDIDTRYQHCILLIYVRTCIVGILGLCFFCNFASDRNFGLSFIDFGKSYVWSMFIWFF